MNEHTNYVICQSCVCTQIDHCTKLKLYQRLSFRISVVWLSQKPRCVSNMGDNLPMEYKSDYEENEENLLQHLENVADSYTKQKSVQIYGAKSDRLFKGFLHNNHNVSRKIELFTLIKPIR